VRTLTFLTMHLDPGHESCQNLRGELAAGQKSLCLSSPDRGRAVERSLVTTGQSSCELNAAGGKEVARYQLTHRTGACAGRGTSA
jgi:hypothetical protein